MSISEDRFPVFQQNQNPLDLYLLGDQDTRRDIILNHPDVSGYVYTQDGTVIEAFHPKKVINWSNSKDEGSKVIAAASGTLQDYTPFSVQESILLSDNFYIIESQNITKKQEQFPYPNI